MAATGKRVNLTPVNAGSPSRLVSRPLLLAGIALAFLIAAAFRWLTLTEFLNDHFDHVALAQQLRLGAVPLRDFVDEGMPLMYLGLGRGVEPREGAIPRRRPHRGARVRGRRRH